MSRHPSPGRSPWCSLYSCMSIPSQRKDVSSKVRFNGSSSTCFLACSAIGWPPVLQVSPKGKDTSRHRSSVASASSCAATVGRSRCRSDEVLATLRHRYDNFQSFVRNLCSAIRLRGVLQPESMGDEFVLGQRARGDVCQGGTHVFGRGGVARHHVHFPEKQFVHRQRH